MAMGLSHTGTWAPAGRSVRGELMAKGLGPCRTPGCKHHWGCVVFSKAFDSSR